MYINELVAVVVSTIGTGSVAHRPFASGCVYATVVLIAHIERAPEAIVAESMINDDLTKAILLKTGVLRTIEGINAWI